MKKYIFLLLITNHLFSFSQIDENPIRCEYKKAFSLYPDSLINHFPNPINKDIVYFSMEYPGATRLNCVYAIFHYKDKRIGEIEEVAKYASLANYNFTDSCLMMTNYDTSWYTPVFDGIIQCKDCANIYPVPNFSFLRELEIDFFEKAKIYVLKAERGNFLDDNILWNEGVGLSKDWLHGYTKGITIGGNLVIYWLEVW